MNLKANRSTSSFEGEVMRDYVRGAFQALAWVRMILANVKDLSGLEKAIAQIDQALEAVKEAVAKDFQEDIQTAIKPNEGANVSK